MPFSMLTNRADWPRKFSPWWKGLKNTQLVVSWCQLTLDKKLEGDGKYLVSSVEA